MAMPAPQAADRFFMVLSMPPPERSQQLVYFLGGRDLEMVTIRDLLNRFAPGRVHDLGLAWGARASSYKEEIKAAQSEGWTPVLVELDDDLRLGPEGVIVVDHHGVAAGRDRPTALEQVFALVGHPEGEWSRWLDLVAANDRGHVRALLRLGATREEVERVRAADRAAQGITPAEEYEGRRAAAAAERLAGGRLTVVRLPHGRVATVTDILEPTLGGPGFETLIVLSPAGTTVFGGGAEIDALRARLPDGFFGGDLPERGYWGCPRPLKLQELVRILFPLWRLPVPKPAAEIAVRAYRQIFLWPLLLKGGPEDTETEQPPLQRWVKTVEHGSAWKAQETLPPDVTPPFNPDNPDFRAVDPTYEEMVYFHPFVRDFLFGDGGPEGDRPMRRLRRRDVRAVEVQLAARNLPITLDVPRIELYLFKPEVALLVVEVALPKPPQGGPLTLADVLNLQSRLRQVYPPFFFGKVPGNCPVRVTWLAKTDNGREFKVESDYDCCRDHFAAFTHRGAEPPVARHWQFLLKPLVPYEGQKTQGPAYQQIEDDRMPGMTYLAVDDSHEISQGDFDRLTFCDTAGTDPYPYSPTFLARDRGDFTYERFWNPDPDSRQSTLYLCSGYQFVAVGKYAPGNREEGFFTDIIPDHFRRMYFRLGLIAHYHRAALLKFADELAEAIKDLKGLAPHEEIEDERFRAKIMALQMTFLKFRSRSWFTEVTNQLQGRELFSWWIKHLDTEALFQRVDETSQRLYEALAEYETRTLTKSQERLSKIAAIGLPIGLVLAAIQVCLGVRGPAPTAWNSLQFLLWLILPGAGVLLLYWGLLGLFGLAPWQSRDWRKTRKRTRS